MLSIAWQILVALVISGRARRLAWLILQRKHIPAAVGIVAGVVTTVSVVFIFVGFGMSLIDHAGAPATPPHAAAQQEVHQPGVHEQHAAVEQEVRQPVAPVPELPWDAPLSAIQRDLSGPTMTSIALIAIVGVFGFLIFGGNIPHFFRSLCYIIMAMSILIAGQNIVFPLISSP